MEQLLTILEDIRPDVDFTNESSLIDGGILDSFDLVSIISEINDVFQIRIGIEHMLPENFNSAQAMMKLIASLQN